MLLWESSLFDFWVDSSFIWMLGGGNWRIRRIWSRFDEIEFVTERNANWKNSTFSPFKIEVKAILIFHEFLKRLNHSSSKYFAHWSKSLFLGPKKYLQFLQKSIWILAPKLFQYNLGKKILIFAPKNIFFINQEIRKNWMFEFLRQNYLSYKKIFLRTKNDVRKQCVNLPPRRRTKVWFSIHLNWPREAIYPKNPRFLISIVNIILHIFVLNVRVFHPKPNIHRWL